MSLESGKKAEQDSRRANIKAEMKKLGLESYEKYLHGDYYDSYEEIKAVITSYIDREYPTLDEVISMLAPFARKKILKKENLWSPNDSICISFVEGDSKWPHLNSVKTAIEQERRVRQDALADELVNQGLPKDFLTKRVPYELECVVTELLEHGRGIPADIAYVAGVHSRLQELKKTFGKHEVYIPRELTFNSNPLRKGKTAFVESYRVQLDKCDIRIQSFLLGSRSDDSNADVLATQLKTERDLRKQLVHDGAIELGINLKLVRDSSSSCRLQLQQMEDFIKKNKGDHAELLSDIALASKLKEHQSQLPDLDDMLRNIPTLRGRIKSAASQGRDGLDLLISELLTEKEDRLLAVKEACVALLGQGDGAMPEDIEIELITSAFVRYGTGQPAKEVQRTLTNIRTQTLLAALKQNGLDGVIHEERFKDFIEGRSGVDSANDFVVKLKQLEDARRNEITEALSSFNITMEDKSVKDNYHLHRYIKQGCQTCTEFVECIVQSKLIDAFRNSSISYWKMKNSRRCEDFVAGKGGAMTAESLVASLAEERRKREAKLVHLIGKPQQALDKIQEYNLCNEIETYLDHGTGNLRWIADAISLQLHFKELESSFGGLQGILGCYNYASLCEWRNNRHEVLEELEKGILGKSIPEMDVIQLIVDFAEPTCSEFLGYELPKKCDHRVALLLAKSPKCPWHNAKEALEVLRQERRKRKIQIDQMFPQCTKTTHGSHTMLFPTEEQDSVDTIWNSSDTRAKYINGIISLDEAKKHLFCEQRNAMLLTALRDGSLNSKLAHKDNRCEAFVKRVAGMDGAKAALSGLISDLQKERSVRLLSLRETFRVFSIVDTGIGVHLSNEYFSDDSDMYDLYGFEDLPNWYDIEAFPGKEEVSCARLDFVDFGKGMAEDVVHAVIMYQRSTKLSDAVGRHFGMMRGEVEKWIHGNQACKHFVAKTDTGYATQEELQLFISNIGEKDQQRPSYGDYDDYAHDDWKYHLSGGTYGDDQDADAMWDSYWDS